MSPRATTLRTEAAGTFWLALSACATVLALMLCGGLLAYLNGMLNVADASFSVVALPSAAVGGVVAAKRPANPVGWLFLGSALAMAFQAFATHWAVYGLVTEPGSLPAARALAWIGLWSGPLGSALMFVVLPLYFPDGRLVSPRWRPVIRLVAFALVADLTLNALVSSTLHETGIANPLRIGLSPSHEDLLLDLGLVVWLGLILVAVVSLVMRFRRSEGAERQQLKWFMYAVSIVLVWFCTNFPLEAALPTLFPLLDAMVVSGVPVAAGIAVMRYRLYDIDLVINRTLVYGALTACVIGTYVLVVGYLGAAFRVEDNLAISVVATGAVAVLFQPLRNRLQRGVDRLMYGDRDDPYAVLSRLGQRLEGTLSPQSVLPTVVETIVGALKVPYAAISLEGDGGPKTAAEYGTPVSEPLTVPLVYQKDVIGRLEVSPRGKDEPFTAADRRLLEDLARQAGVAAHAVRLTADLQRSRERLVTAREEERRRLRRDLHDGVGPQLAALTLKIETARNRLAHDPEAVDLLSDLAGRARVAVADVRRSVHALRPPALDELGLVPALRETAAQYSQNGLCVSVEVPEEVLPPLPAAVEVAAYRIAHEAMINAVRHAGATSCTVRFGLDREGGLLRLEVEDDGLGIGPDRGVGVGLSSMRERAEELGGTCTVGPRPGGGTRVRAELPGVAATRGARP